MDNLKRRQTALSVLLLIITYCCSQNVTEGGTGPADPGINVEQVIHSSQPSTTTQAAIVTPMLSVSGESHPPGDSKGSPEGATSQVPGSTDPLPPGGTAAQVAGDPSVTSAESMTSRSEPSHGSATSHTPVHLGEQSPGGATSQAPDEPGAELPGGATDPTPDEPGTGGTISQTPDEPGAELTRDTTSQTPGEVGGHTSLHSSTEPETNSFTSQPQDGTTVALSRQTSAIGSGGVVVPTTEEATQKYVPTKLSTPSDTVTSNAITIHTSIMPSSGAEMATTSQKDTQQHQLENVTESVLVDNSTHPVSGEETSASTINPELVVNITGEITRSTPSMASALFSSKHMTTETTSDKHSTDSTNVASTQTSADALSRLTTSSVEDEVTHTEPTYSKLSTGDNIINTSTANVVADYDTTTTEQKEAEKSTLAAVPTTSANKLNNLRAVCVLQGNCSVLLNDPLLEKDFRNRFKDAIANKANILSSTIKIDKIECGSVNVTFRVLNLTKEGEGQLFSLINGNDIVVTVGSNYTQVYISQTAHVLDWHEPTVTVTTLSSAKPSIIPGPPHGKRLTSIQLIIIIVFSIIGGFLLIIALVFLCYACHQKRRSKSFDLALAPGLHVGMDDFTLEKIQRPRPFYSDRGIIMQPEDGLSLGELGTSKSVKGMRGMPPSVSPPPPPSEPAPSPPHTHGLTNGKAHKAPLLNHGNASSPLHQMIPLKGSEKESLMRPHTNSFQSPQRRGVGSGFDNPSFSSDDILDSGPDTDQELPYDNEPIRYHPSPDRKVGKNSHISKSASEKAVGSEGATAF